MKRKLALILLVCFSLSMVLVGCGSNTDKQQSKADDSWTKIQKTGYFVVGLDDAFPPMGFREEGTNDIVGFDIDMAKEAAKRMGVEVKFQPVVWDTITEELNGGKIDVIWNGLTITPEREAKIAFTKPYLGNRQIVVVQKNSAIKAKNDLKGKKLGIQAGSSAMIALDSEPEIKDSLSEIAEFGSNDEALLDLASGRLDAVLVDEVVGRFYISKKPDTYKVLEESFAEEEYGVGMRKGDDAFRAELQKALDDMKADGTSAQISNKWFGEDIVK